jgi:hypothetical protein
MSVFLRHGASNDDVAPIPPDEYRGGCEASEDLRTAGRRLDEACQPCERVDTVHGSAAARALDLEQSVARVVVSPARSSLDRVDAPQPTRVSRPRSTKSWASKAVLGERIWNLRRLPGASCGISAGRAVGRTGKTDGIGAGTLWCGLGSTSSLPCAPIGNRSQPVARFWLVRAVFGARAFASGCH